LYSWHYQHGAELAYARTIAVTTLVMFEVFYLFTTRYLYACVLTPRGLFGNRWVLVAIAAAVCLQGLFVYAGPLQFLFASRPIALHDWPSILLVSVSVLLLLEVEKALLRVFGMTPKTV
jgi:magnesium-transporting ATPase (P-type)